MSIEIVYNKPTEAPPGLQAVIDCLNGSTDLSFRVINTKGLENYWQQHFASESGDDLVAVTPNPRVSVAWHRNTIDMTSPVVIEMAEAIKDHYGNTIAIVTGWSMGVDGRTHAFATRPMTPRNPGGATNYRQRNRLTEEFVEIARSTIGKVSFLRQNGWGSSLPVLVGRSSLQVTGLTCAQLCDSQGTVLYSADEHMFEADTESEKPALRKRERTRNPGRAYWPVLTDQKVLALENAAKGESPEADNGNGDDMEAFLATVAAS